ncbi:MAG TPA: hypothetical protein VD883_01900, partial [Candidatus Omnitrophota bacterium]|nr:hypothetical protein [Candidatus Omnitrophota bacterium]
MTNRKTMSRGSLPNPETLLKQTDKLLSRASVIGVTDHQVLIVQKLEELLQNERDRTALNRPDHSLRRQEAVLEALRNIESILNAPVRPGADVPKQIRDRVQKLIEDEKRAVGRSDALIQELESLLKEDPTKTARERARVVLKREFLRDGVGKGRFLKRDLDAEGRPAPFTQDEMDEVEKNSSSKDAATLLARALSNDTILYLGDQGQSLGAVALSSNNARVTFNLLAHDRSKRHVFDRVTYNVTGKNVFLTPGGVLSVGLDDQKRPLRLEKLIRPDHSKTSDLSGRSPVAGYDRERNTITRDTRVEKTLGVRTTGAVGYKAYDTLGYLVSETFHKRYRTIVRRHPLSHQELGQISFGYNAQDSKARGEDIYNIPLSWTVADLSRPGRAEIHLLHTRPILDESGLPILDENLNPKQYLYHKDGRAFSEEEMRLVQSTALFGPQAENRDKLFEDAQTITKEAFYDRFGDLTRDKIGRIEVEELYDAAGFGRGSREWFVSADGKTKIILSEGRPAQRTPNNVLVDKYVYRYVPKKLEDGTEKFYLQSRTEKEPDGSAKLIDAETLTLEEIEALPSRVHAVRVRELRAPHGKLLTQVASGRNDTEGDVQVRVDYDTSDREIGQRDFGRDEETKNYLVPKSAGIPAQFDAETGRTEILAQRYRMVEGGRYLVVRLKSHMKDEYAYVQPLVRVKGKTYFLRGDLLREDILKKGKIYFESEDGVLHTMSGVQGRDGLEILASDILSVSAVPVRSGLDRSGRLLYEIVGNVKIEVVYDQASRAVEYIAYAWDGKDKIKDIDGNEIILSRGENFRIRPDGVLITKGRQFLYTPVFQEDGSLAWKAKKDTAGKPMSVPLEQGYFGNGNLDEFKLGEVRTNVEYRGGIENARVATIVADGVERAKSRGFISDVRDETSSVIQAQIFHYNKGQNIKSFDTQLQIEDFVGRQLGIVDPVRNTETVVIRDAKTGLKIGAKSYRNGRLFQEMRIVDFTDSGEEIIEVTNHFYDLRSPAPAKDEKIAPVFSTRSIDVRKPHGDMQSRMTEERPGRGLIVKFLPGSSSKTHLDEPKELLGGESGKAMEKTVDFKFDPKTLETTETIASIFTNEVSREIVRDRQGMLILTKQGAFETRFDPAVEAATGFQKPIGIFYAGTNVLFEKIEWGIDTEKQTVIQTNIRQDKSAEIKTVRRFDGTLLSRNEKRFKVDDHTRPLKHSLTEFNTDESRRLGFEVPTVTWDIRTDQDNQEVRSVKKKYSNARYNAKGQPTIDVWDAETGITKITAADYDGTPLSEEWADVYTGGTWIAEVESMRDRFLKYRHKSKLSYVTSDGIVRPAADYVYDKQYRVDVSDQKVKIENISDILRDPTGVPEEIEPLATKKIEAGLRKISEDLGIRRMTLVQTKVTVGGSTSYHYRIEEDTEARILIFRLGDQKSNLVVNTQWEGENSIEGYEFSQLGKVFKLKSDRTPVTNQDFFKKFEIGLPIQDDLIRRHVLIKDAGPILLSRTERFLLDDKSMNEINDEKGSVLREEGYVMRLDPLLRNFASIQNGPVRFYKWFGPDHGAPFGVSPGEVVVLGGRYQTILRETEFHRVDELIKEYIYRVTYDMQPGRSVKNPGFYLGYNYYSGVVWEHYVDQEWKLYSKDSFPLLVMKTEGRLSTDQYAHTDFREYI